MPTLRYLELSADDFNDCDWQSVIANATKKVCEEYYKLFFRMASEAEETGNQKCCEVFTILGAISSMRLRLDSNAVFEPLFYFGDMRGFMLDDLKEHQLSTLSELAPLIQDAEMRARVADVVWTKGRNRYFSMVNVAVQAYLKSAITLLQPEEDVLDSGTFFSLKSMERFQRALNLASSTNQPSLVLQLISSIDDIVQRHDKEDKAFPFIGLMRILLSQPDSIEINRYAALCKELAEKAEIRSDWLTAPTYWSLKAEFDNLAGNSDEQRNSRIRYAEAHVKFAEVYANMDTPNYAAACFQLRRAIEIYRAIGGMRSRYEQLLNQIVQYEELSMNDWLHVSVPFDVGELPHKIMAEFRGKPWQEAIIRLAAILPSTNIQELRERVEGYFSEVTSQSLFAIVGTSITDYRGRTIDTSPPLLGATEEARNRAIAARMFQEASRNYFLRASAMIAPAVAQIGQDHYTRVTDWSFLVENNGFVPNDRIYLYMKGLHAGFTGDFITSTHILIPQLENSLRYVLEQQGIRPYSLDTRTGVREVHTLETILANESLIETLGEGTIFDLKALLIRRFGNNYRNDLAHGLLTTDHFLNPNLLYLWWLVLNLCWRGLPRHSDGLSEEDYTNYA